MAEQPGDFKDLPEEFQKAYSLWRKNQKKNMGEIIKLLTPYVGAAFVAPALNDWEELFTGPRNEEVPEYPAVKIHVVGIDFKAKPIPKCRAEAWFEVSVVTDFDNIDLDAWQEEHGARLYDGVCFSWEIPRNAATEDLDFTYGDHLGVEAMVVQQIPESTGASWRHHTR